MLNVVEASACKGDKKRARGRLLCTSACLQCVAKTLEKEGDKICLVMHISTRFGEGIAFDNAKVTWLVINAVGLEQVGKERSTNVSDSMDAAHVTKNLCHTSADLKMTDIGGRDPLKNMRAFIVDQTSLRDLQSQNNIFLLKIVLMKEAKESFKLFKDVELGKRIGSVRTTR